MRSIKRNTKRKKSIRIIRGGAINALHERKRWITINKMLTDRCISYPKINADSTPEELIAAETILNLVYKGNSTWVSMGGQPCQGPAGARISLIHKRNPRSLSAARAPATAAGTATRRPKARHPRAPAATCAMTPPIDFGRQVQPAQAAAAAGTQHTPPSPRIPSPTSWPPSPLTRVTTNHPFYTVGIPRSRSRSRPRPPSPPTPPLPHSNRSRTPSPPRR